MNKHFTISEYIQATVNTESDGLSLMTNKHFSRLSIAFSFNLVVKAFTRQRNGKSLGERGCYPFHR